MGRALLDDAQPRLGARRVAAAVAGTDQATEDLGDHRRVVAVPADDQRACFVQTRHAVANATRRHQGQSRIAERLALQVGILELVSQRERDARAGLEFLGARNGDAEQPDNHISLLHAILVLEQAQSAGKPGTPHHLVIEHVEVDPAERGRRQGCPLRLAPGLEIAIGALELLLRLGDIGREVRHLAQKHPVLGVVRGLDNLAQGADGARDVAVAGQMHRRHSFGRYIVSSGGPERRRISAPPRVGIPCHKHCKHCPTVRRPTSLGW